MAVNCHSILLQPRPQTRLRRSSKKGRRGKREIVGCSFSFARGFFGLREEQRCTLAFSAVGSSVVSRDHSAHDQTYKCKISRCHHQGWWHKGYGHKAEYESQNRHEPWIGWYSPLSAEVLSSALRVSASRAIVGGRFSTVRV